MYINEVLAHTDEPQIDMVELYNPGVSPVDLIGWCVSDDKDNVRKYCIPAPNSAAEPPVIVGGGYFLLTAAELGFAFSEFGEEVILSAPASGCFLGTCSATGNSCELGYCVEPSDACMPGSQGCTVGSGCQAGTELVEHGGFCVLPVTYSDGWTWRVLWDLLDEGEDVQPEVSHWRTSQMSTSDPDVGPTYDTFSDVKQFWRTLFRSVGNDAIDPIPTDNFHPDLSDLIDRWRCDVGDDAFVALNDYLVNVVEFPYHNPGMPCP